MYGRKPPTKRYMAAFGALYGDIPAEEVPKPRKKRRYEEDVEQIKFNLWFDSFLWEKDYRWFHVPNGGRRSKLEGAKFKRMGVKPGIPDIVCPMARSPYHGLVIELKKIDGVPSDVSAVQKDWHEWFKRQNWSVHVAFGYEQAKKIIINYFNIE